MCVYVCVRKREDTVYEDLFLKIDEYYELIINASFCFKVDHRNLFLHAVSVLSP